MNNKYNILIIGNNIHTIRYIESLMFNNKYNLLLLKVDNSVEPISQKYGLKLIETSFLYSSISEYNLIILSDMLNINVFDLLKKIISSNYKGKFILEKPLTFEYNKSKKITKLLEKNRYLVAYTRQFYDINVDFDKERLEIEWPNFYQYKIEPLKNTLPHILDLIFKISDINKYKKIKLVYAIKLKQNFYIKLIIGKKVYLIRLYDGKNLNELVRINGIAIEWPNYFKIINKMVEIVLSNEISVLDNNIISLKINRVLEKVKNNIGGIVMLEKNYSYNKRVQYKDTGHVLMAYNEDNSDMYEFNDIGAEIFKMITREVPINEIYSTLKKEYDASEEEIYKDFEDIINRFIDLGIIVIK